MPTCKCKSSGDGHANGCTKDAVEGKDGFCEDCFVEDRKVQKMMEGVLGTKERKKRRYQVTVPSKRENEELTNDLAEQLKEDNPPKAGDTVIFPSERVRIESVSARLVWFSSRKEIPVDDLAPSGEPNTWEYTGDTQAV